MTKCSFLLYAKCSSRFTENFLFSSSVGNHVLGSSPQNVMSYQTSMNTKQVKCFEKCLKGCQCH